MRLAAALQKLERRAKDIVLCDWCKFIWPVGAPLSAEPSRSPDEMFSRCPWCGSTINYSLRGYDEYEREALRLENGKYSGEVYRDERVFAAREWVAYSRRVKRWGVSVEELKEVVRAFTKEKRAKAEKEKARPEKLRGEALRRAEVQAKATAFIKRKLEEEKERYGPLACGLSKRLEALKEIVKVDEYVFVGMQRIEVTDVEKWLRWELYLCRVAELCEGVLWGKVLPRTRLAVRNLSALVNRMQEKREEQKREAEEAEARRKAERERERLERDAEYQRQRAEREAALRPAHASQTAPVDSYRQTEEAPTSRMWTLPDGDEPELDERGRKRVSIPWIGQPPISEGDGR